MPPRERRRRNLPPATLQSPNQGPLVGGRSVSTARHWRWRTFPVLCTFSITFFTTTLLMLLVRPTTVGAVLLVLSCLPLALVLAHLVTVAIVGPHLKPPARR
ncbi:MAG: hypothetical protein ACYDCQ_04805 [Dehalococcoidia bacterium]